MAKLRKFCAYKSVKRPYTRFSKYKTKNYIRSRPHCRITMFDLGNKQKQFKHCLKLISKDRAQIRDTALESARQTANKWLEKTLSVAGYRLVVQVFPHHVLRENPLASAAGADRMSTGMAHSFGKNIGVAAQVSPGKVLMSVYYDEDFETAKKALKRASLKLPVRCIME
ncbi:50S ribosomal protein L16 [Candidatus Woesearchaeota archaeon]|nr:50S ribosomal protein L16 [Candidatus Woesearchaeota archaeon]